MNKKNMKTLCRLTGNHAFFNVRVLIGLFVFLAGVFPALVVRANPPIIKIFPQNYRALLCMPTSPRTSSPPTTA